MLVHIGVTVAPSGAGAPFQVEAVQEGLGTEHSAECKDGHHGGEAWQHVEDDSGHGRNLKHCGYCTLQRMVYACGGGGGGGSCQMGSRNGIITFCSITRERGREGK